MEATIINLAVLATRKKAIETFNNGFSLIHEKPIKNFTIGSKGELVIWFNTDDKSTHIFNVDTFLNSSAIELIKKELTLNEVVRV